jgi:hypothetical protein
MSEKLGSNTKSIRIFQRFGFHSARLMVNDKYVAGIWDNVPYRDPSLSPSHDYAGQIVADDSRVYFPSWEKAMEWLKGLDK